MISHTLFTEEGEIYDQCRGTQTTLETFSHYRPERGWEIFEPWHITTHIIGCFSNYVKTIKVIPLITTPSTGCMDSAPCQRKNKPGISEAADLKRWGITAKYGWQPDDRYRDFNINMAKQI